MRTNWTVTRRNYFLLLMTFLAGISWAAPAPDMTVYSNTSNKELKQKALRLVKNIRELVDSYKKKDRELMAEYDKKNKPEAMGEQWLKESDTVHDSAMRTYRDNYWADAILLRNELYRRLQRLAKEPNQTTKKPNQTNLGPIYQHPTNVLGIQVIADDLERISKLLPD
jgi:uncharacterized NAD(P)/FAD-binding protein YdhS